MKENYEENILIKQIQICTYTCYCASTMYVLDQNRERENIQAKPLSWKGNCELYDDKKENSPILHAYLQCLHVVQKKKKIHIDVYHLRKTKPDIWDWKRHWALFYSFHQQGCY